MNEEIIKMLEKSMAQTDKALEIINKQSEQIERLLKDLEATT